MDQKRKAETSDPIDAVGDPAADIDALHRQALAEIEARGESPDAIMRSYERMMQFLRAKHLPGGKAPADQAEALANKVPSAAIAIDEVVFFDEAVAAGAPIASDASQGRPAALSDLFGTTDLRGKIIAKVSGWSMRGSAINDGDIVMADPAAAIQDGDIVLADVAGHGRVVKRFRRSRGDMVILESAHPDFPPILIANPDDLRLHGKVLWRAGHI